MADLKIQHLDIQLANGGTHTLPEAVSSLDNAFVKVINSTRKGSAGPVGSTGNAGPSTGSGAMDLTGVSTITGRANGGTQKLMGQVWEYTGPSGGAHEFIVRSRVAVTIPAGSTLGTQSIAGIVTPGKVVPFGAGWHSTATGTSDHDASTFGIRMNGTTLEVSRQSTTGILTVYVTVVEFVGSSWTVATATSSSHDTAAETVTLSTDITDWGTAFIEATGQGDTSETGLADCLFLVRPGAATNQVIVDYQSGDAAARNDGDAFVYVVQNPDMIVTRNTSNQALAEGNNSYGANVSFPAGTNATRALNELGLEWSVSTNGTGTAHMRACIGAVITDAAGTIRNWVHRSGNNIIIRYGVIDVSQMTDPGGPTPTDIESDRSLEVHGTLDDNNQRSLEIIGSIDQTNERSFEIDGQLPPEEWQIQRQADGGAWTTIEASILISDPFDYVDVGPFTAGVTYCYRVRSLIRNEGWTNTDCVLYADPATDIENDRALEIHGSVDDDAERSLEISGEAQISNERGLETHGQANDQNERGFVTDGQETTENDRNMEVHGSETDGLGVPFEIDGQISVQDDRNFEVRGSIDVDAERGFEVDGVEATIAERSFEIDGFGSLPDDRSMETHGTLDDENDRGFEIDGALGSDASRGFDITGIEDLDNSRNFETRGSITADDSRNAEIHGEAESVTDRGLEIRGALDDSDSRSMEVRGQLRDDADRGMEIDGQLGLNADRGFEIDGDQDGVDAVNLEVHGEDSIDQQRSLEIRGQDRATADRGFIIIGQIEESAEIAFEIFGAFDEANDRSFEVDGILGANNERGFEIRGISPSRKTFNVMNKSRGLDLVRESDDKCVVRPGGELSVTRRGKNYGPRHLGGNIETS